MTPEAFLKSGKSLNDLPQNERTRELCEVAIQKDGNELRFVPLPLRTVRLTRLACGNKAFAYRFAPAGVRADYELAVYALRRGGIPVWERIPEQIIDYPLCLTGVRGCGALLGIIPPRFKTFELCKLAFTQGGAEVGQVPEEFLADPEFWKDVALKHVPDPYKSYPLCMQGVRRCGSYLQYVPDQHRDVILCSAAVAENTWACRFVPERHHRHEFFQASYAAAKAAGAPYVIPTLESKEFA